MDTGKYFSGSQAKDLIINSLDGMGDKARAYILDGIEAVAQVHTTPKDGESGWVGEPGQMFLADTVTENRRWVTASEAAQEFNLGVREIEERYRPEVQEYFPGSVLEPLTECEYLYDFESPDFSWDGYEELYEKLKEDQGPVGYGESFDCYPEMAKGFVPDPDEDSDALMLKSHDEWGYDKKLEPKTRTTTREVSPRLYYFATLSKLRDRKLRSRKNGPVTERGARGRFVKKTE